MNAPDIKPCFLDQRNQLRIFNSALNTFFLMFANGLMVQKLQTRGLSVLCKMVAWFKACLRFLSSGNCDTYGYIKEKHIELNSEEALVKFFQEILDGRDELEELEKKGD